MIITRLIKDQTLKILGKYEGTFNIRIGFRNSHNHSLVTSGLISIQSPCGTIVIGNNYSYVRSPNAKYAKLRDWPAPEIYYEDILNNPNILKKFRR